MDRGKTKLKGDALVNKVALILIETICWAIILGYISDFREGNSTILYFASVEAAAALTAVTLPIIYFAAPKALRFVGFVMFAILDCIAVLGAGTDVAFVMAFPIVAVFVLYYDHKLMKWMVAIFGIITVLDIANIVLVIKHHHSGLDINSSILLMEFLGTMIYLVAIERVTAISIQNNTEKIRQIQDAADKVNAAIVEINGDLSHLTTSSESVKNAMDEINTGISNTAEAVQNQLLQTEEIQDKIEGVAMAADQISERMNTTMSAVNDGHREVEALVQNADASVELSNKVSENLALVQSNIEAMTAITQMIESIAFQTNIMALNANVEAAHAGEVGRGFAVVANEISAMSTKTKTATDDITELIQHATDSLKVLVNSIQEMSAMIQSEKTQTESTFAIFAAIQENSENVSQNVAAFMDHINGLNLANREIVSSVSTISAVTEQVTALANEALNMERGNAESVEKIARQMEALA